MGTLGEALTSSEFLTGLVAGVVALAVGFASGVVFRRHRPLALGGALWALAASIALPGLGTEVWAGLALLGLAGLVFAHLSRLFIVSALVAMPGAWLLAFHGGVGGPAWMPWLVMAAVVLACPLTAETDAFEDRPVLGPLLWAITVAGIYLDVPDTEGLLVLAGAAAPLALLAWPLEFARLGGAGSYAGVGLLVLVTAWGGEGRPASVVGGVACLGVLLTVPMAERITRATVSRDGWLVAIHVGVVLVCSRVAGLQSDPLVAGVVAGVALVAALAILIRFRVALPATQPTQ